MHRYAYPHILVGTRNRKYDAGCGRARKPWRAMHHHCRALSRTTAVEENAEPQERFAERNDKALQNKTNDQREERKNTSPWRYVFQTHPAKNHNHTYGHTSHAQKKNFLLTLGVPLRLLAGAELDGLFAGHRYSKISTPGPPCWRSRDPESKATLLALLLRRRPINERHGTSTRMATRPVPSMPGPGGTLQRRTVCETISDCARRVKCGSRGDRAGSGSGGARGASASAGAGAGGGAGWMG